LDTFINFINILCVAIPISLYYIFQLNITPVLFTYILIPIVYYHIKKGHVFTINVFKISIFLIIILFCSSFFIKSINSEFIYNIVLDLIILTIATTLIVFMIDNILRKNKLLINKTNKDQLTGLYNKRYFSFIINKIFEKCSQQNRNLSILILDLDHFKRCNDNCGHLAGDKMLKEIGRILKNTIRKNDIAIRYGGEEFLIILKNTNLKEAKKMAERLRKTIEDYRFSGIKIASNPPCSKCQKTVSIGISTINNQCTNPTELVEEADKALYKAKEERNKVCTFLENKK
jgi:diguanylate cyclase (GGDEF)-like protein